MSIFTFLSAFALGLWGLFAWPRRHAVATAFFALLLFIYAIVVISVIGSGNGDCFPCYDLGDGNIGVYRGLSEGPVVSSCLHSLTQWSTATTIFTPPFLNSSLFCSLFPYHVIYFPFCFWLGILAGNQLQCDQWCGSHTAVFVTHGLLIALLVFFFFLALLISREEREWEKGTHVSGTQKKGSHLGSGKIFPGGHHTTRAPTTTTTTVTSAAH